MNFGSFAGNPSLPGNRAATHTSARGVPDHFTICYITDRLALHPASVVPVILGAIRAGVDLVQIREKELSGRDLMEIVRPAVESARGTQTQVVVNDRLDVALASDAAGVHLGTKSFPVRAMRQHVARGFLVGASCHSLQEVQEAEAAGASYVLLGPIFETPSKLRYGPPLGLAKLQGVTARVNVPVLALGGITVSRVRTCSDAGASGIAGISIFQNAPSIEHVVQQIRAEWPNPKPIPHAP
jgi:thiamine-phosphate pyrophosphorylase